MSFTHENVFSFATDSFVNILSEARKYRLDLIIAHQYIGQLTTDTSTAVRDAVFGNVGTMISFRVGAADAEVLELEFTPEFLQNDLIRLPNYNIYLKLMIDGISSRPFSAKTIAPAPFVKDPKKRDEIIKISRSKYAHTVKAVEDEINRWAANLDVPSVNDTQSPSDLSNPQAPSRPLYQPSGSQNNSRPSDSTKLYNVKCSNCGKDTKVIFEPVAGRPVYCKSCLKKLKAGEIAPASGGAPGRMTGSEEGERKPADQVKWTNGAPASRQSGQVNKQEGDSALADLGIEFTPTAPIKSAPSNPPKRDFVRRVATKSPTRPEKLEEPEAKIETISFKSSNRRNDDLKNQEKPAKRKEVNLSELRKALEESLSKKEPDKVVDSLDFKPKNSKEELKERIEEEKFEDKAVGDESPKVISPPQVPKLENPAKPDDVKLVKPEDKKKSIKPGETIKL